MRLVLGEDERVGLWAAAAFGSRPFLPPYVAFGVEDDQGQLAGAFLFNNYNGHNIEVTIIGGVVLRRRFIRAAIRYAFLQLKVLRVTARTRRSNKTMRAIMPRVGFIQEGCMKNYFGPLPGDDALIYRLGREQARRWIGDIPDAV